MPPEIRARNLRGIEAGPRSEAGNRWRPGRVRASVLRWHAAWPVPPRDLQGQVVRRRFGKSHLDWIPCKVVRIHRPVVRAVLVLLLAMPSALSGQETEQADLQRAIASYDAGQFQEALALLQSAPALLSRHDSAVRSLYTGLVQFALGEPDAARRAFAEAVRTEPSMRLDPAVHSPARIAAFEAARVGVVDELRQAARAMEADGNSGGALDAWRRLLDAEPEDEEAARRIAAIQEVQRQEALARQQELLAEVGAGDSTVSESSGTGEGPGGELYSPGRALALGLVVPGLGQFYTGRPARGLLALGVAGGVVAVGLLTERVDVDCASVPDNGICPAEDVLDERTRHPYLTPAIAVAVGIGVIGAIDAFISARNANAERAEATRADGPRLLLPAVGVDRSGRLRADLLRLRFW